MSKIPIHEIYRVAGKLRKLKPEEIKKEWDRARKKHLQDYEDYLIAQLFSDNPEVFFLW